MKAQQQISSDEALRIGEALYIDWGQVDLEQFRQGLMDDHKQGCADLEADQTYDGVLLSGKVILTHMQEFPDYFTRLEKLRVEANEYRTRRR